MTRELRRLWPTAPTTPADPAGLDVRLVLTAMPPGAQFVVDRPAEPDRAEHYLQVERSSGDANHWRIEIRHGDANQHMVTSVSEPDAAEAIVRAWLTDEDSTPPAPRWWRYRGWHPFADRLYLLTAYIASDKAIPLWRREPWRQLAPALGPVLQAGRGRTSVRSLQVEPPAPTVRRKPVVFGAMTWGPRSEEKWTHGTTTMRRFLNAEVIAPSWPTSYREGIPPDVIFRISSTVDHADRFNVLVATATDMDHPGAAHLHEQLASQVEPVLVATKHRPFGLGMGSAYAQPLDEFDPIGSVIATAPTELRDEQQTGRPGPPLEPWRSGL